MSLYDDLDAGTKNKEAAGWSTGIKLLQTTLQTKKASTQPVGKVKRGALNPVVDLKRPLTDEVHFDLKTGKVNRGGIAQFLSVEPSVFAGVKDEYNPMIPNDYDEIIKKRRRERKDREKERDIDRDRDDERSTRRRSTRRRDSDEENDDREKKSTELMPRRNEEDEDDYHRERPKRGAAIAPPPSLLEDSNSSTPPPDTGLVANPFGLEDDSPPARVLPGTSIGLGGSVASKIMAKYGYKEGSGLGKSGQGMASALVVEKTSRRGGKILHEKDIQRYSPTSMLPPTKPLLSNADLLKNPSKVVLLRNMVGPGEVDPELEGETAEECGKYGKVTKCVIFEIAEVPEEESVRIFVEFEKQESAIKAIIDLNGRFFGGRIVKACFYSVDKFKRLDLADDLL